MASAKPKANFVNNASCPQPSQDVIAQYPLSLLDLRKRYRKILLAFGMTEVIIGGILVFLTIATVTVAKGPNYYFGGDVYCFFGDFFTYVGIGIWCGVCGLSAGVLGIVIKIKQSASLYIANMTVAIITAHFSCVGVVLSSLAARFSVCQFELRELHIALATLCFIMMVVNIAHAAVCCGRTCCDEGYLVQQQLNPPSQQNVVYPQTTLANSQHLIVNEIHRLEQSDPVVLQSSETKDDISRVKNENCDKIVTPASVLESRVDRSEPVLKSNIHGGTDASSSSC